MRHPMHYAGLYGGPDLDFQLQSGNALFSRALVSSNVQEVLSSSRPALSKPSGNPTGLLPKPASSHVLETDSPAGWAAS
jgi:hypothetical protein